MNFTSSEKVALVVVQDVGSMYEALLRAVSALGGGYTIRDNKFVFISKEGEWFMGWSIKTLSRRKYAVHIFEIK